MKLTVRTLDQKSFQVEADPSDTILAVKGHIRAVKGHKASLQTLVFSGKVLSNGQTVEECGIQETDFLVLMVTAAKKPSTPPPSVDSPVPQTPTPKAEAAPAPQAASSQPDDHLVDQLAGMGFPQSEVRLALAAAYGNPDRAVEYLMTGIPAIAREEANPGPPPPPSPSPPVSQPPNAATATAPAPPAAQPAANVLSAGPFAALAGQDSFLQMRLLLQQSPQLLRPFLEEMGRRCPDFIRLVSANQEAFLEAINSTDFPRPVGPPGVHVLTVTPEEKEAIDRLIALGFNREQAVEAYLTCDKNETLAANYLMDRANWD